MLVAAVAGSSHWEGAVVSKPRAGEVRERGTHQVYSASAAPERELLPGVSRNLAWLAAPVPAS